MDELDPNTLDVAFDGEPNISTQEFNNPPNPEDDIDIETMWDLVWDVSNTDMSRKGLTRESISLLSSPENERSKEIYRNHQEKYLSWCEDNSCSPYIEESCVNYFTYNYQEGPYGPGSFWQMFSCIRSYILVETKVEIKNWSLLRKLIKGITAKHIKKKRNLL